MLSNYVISAWRNLIKHPLYAAINILGLAVGLAAALLITVFVRHELSYDRWVPDHERVFRLESRLNVPSAPSRDSFSAPGALMPLIEEHLAGVEAQLALFGQQTPVAFDDEVFSLDLIIADPSIFEIFAVELLAGNPATALADPSALVLAESEARRLFGGTDVIGRTVTVNGTDTLRVTGVMPDWPKASDLELTALAPQRSPAFLARELLMTNWGSLSGNVFLKLTPDTTPEAVEAGLADLLDAHGPPRWFTELKAQGLPPIFEMSLRPLTDLHLRGENGGYRPSGSVEALWICAGTALLILAIAGINATNLGAAHAATRVREVVVRRVLGASGRHLAMQLIVEAQVLAYLALLVGMGLAELALPAFADIMVRPLDRAMLLAPAVLAPGLVLPALVGLFSGAYPALIALRLRPAEHLAGKRSGGRKGGVRTFLVIGQFAASIALVSVSLVMFAQAEFARSRDPGYAATSLVRLSGLFRPIVREKRDALIEALRQVDGVEAVTAMEIVPGSRDRSSAGVTRSDGETITLDQVSVSETFFDTFDARLVAGRLFETGREADRVRAVEDGYRGAIVLSRSGVARLGFASPQAALGETVSIGHQDGTVSAEIIGVVGDVQFRSVREKVEATYFWIVPDDFAHIVLRLTGRDTDAALARVDRLWRDFFPALPVDRGFIEDAVADYYAGDRRQGRLMLWATLLAIVIACSGLYALAALSAEHRTKEIGMRKVLGARVGDVMRLMLWQFSKPVLIANLIAWPLAWWALSGWLEGFAYRIDLTPLPFVAAGLGALLIAWATVAAHASRVARSNPVHALRRE